MPTMAEIRQKYPQYNDMSDKDLATALHDKYYSDMPFNDFAAKVGLATEPAKREPYTGMILPMQVDENGKYSAAVPRMLTGIVDSATSAFTAPYRAMTGELPMTDEKGRTSPQAIEEGFNMATWVSPASPAEGTLPGIRKMWELNNPKVATEGEKVAESASRLGVQLPKAVTSDSATVQNLGKKLAELPVVGTPLQDASKTAVNQLDDAARGVQSTLGTGDMAVAGNKVKTAISDFATTEEPAAVTELYSKLRKSVDPTKTTQISNTAKIAQSLAERDARQGFKSNSAAEFIKGAVGKDMSYEDIKGLRTRVGNMLSDPQGKELANLKVTQQDMEALYSGLTKDLKEAVVNAGGQDGLKLFEEANSRASMFARDKKTLNRILGTTSDEGAASNLIAMAGNTSRANIKDLMLAKSKIGKDAWDEVSAAALSKISGEQGQFSPAKFSTAWNKISPSGKKILFDPKTRAALDDIATVSSRFKQLQQYSNPSQSGALAVTALGGGGIIAGFFDPTKLAITATTAVTGRGLSWYLARPERIRALADYSKAYEIAATKPAQSSQIFLSAAAKRLALIAANDAGNPAIANGLMTKLATVQKAAADNQNGAQIGQEESQNKGMTEQQRFGDAYAQGNAF